MGSEGSGIWNPELATHEILHSVLKSQAGFFTQLHLQNYSMAHFQEQFELVINLFQPVKLAGSQLVTLIPNAQISLYQF